MSDEPDEGAAKPAAKGDLSERPSQRGVATQQTRTMHLRASVSEVHFGMLLPPATLEQYERIIPGFGQKITDSFLVEGEHRREGERAERIARTHGMRYAFVIVLVFAAIALVAILRGYPWAGTTILGGPLVGLVTIFIYSKRSKDRRSQVPSSNNRSQG